MSPCTPPTHLKTSYTPFLITIITIIYIFYLQQKPEAVHIYTDYIDTITITLKWGGHIQETCAHPLRNNILLLQLLPTCRSEQLFSKCSEVKYR